MRPRHDRRALLKTLAATGVTIAFSAGSGAAIARELDAEAAVQSYMSEALNLLGESASSPANQNAAALETLITSFIAFDRIATFVLGRYAVAVRDDRALANNWRAAFRAYALANYKVRLDHFRGRSHRTTGSVSRVPGHDVIVAGEIYGGPVSDPTHLGWRVIKTADAWQAFDLAVRLDGNEVWLAQQQQREFLDVLDRANGDVQVLIDNVQRRTALLEARARAR